MIDTHPILFRDILIKILTYVILSLDENHKIDHATPSIFDFMELKWIC